MGRDKDDRKRHRTPSHKSKRHSSRHEKRDERGSEDLERDRGGSKKLTEDEERLYKTAKAYVQEQENNERNDARKKRARRDDGSISEGSRHKSHRKDRHKSDRKKNHKRNRKDDDRDKKKLKHRHEHHRDKEGKKESKQPSFDTSKLISLGPITNKPPTQPLDPSLNYFSHNSHLRLYLYYSYGVYFEDLSSNSSRKYFTEFVDRYNSGKLEEAYYQSQLPDEALNQCMRTKHQWKFRTNDIEEEKLNMVKAGVRKQTEYNATQSVTPASAASTVPPREPKEDAYDREKSYQDKRAAQKLSDKRYREQVKIANEEIYGIDAKPTSGWERQQMKKREQANKTHGAHRDKEDAIGGVDLDDDAIYGSGEIGGGRGRDVDFKEAVSKERARRERREAEMAKKVEEGKKKEEEKRKEMLAMLGLTNVDAGKKITIAPRRDNGA